MFGPRYFGTRYFGTRYWGREAVGAVQDITDTDAIQKPVDFLLAEKERPRLALTLKDGEVQILGSKTIAKRGGKMAGVSSFKTETGKLR